MKVCRCCKSQISTQKCHNCGFINVAVLDEEAEIQEQKIAEEYRVNVLKKSSPAHDPIDDTTQTSFEMEMQNQPKTVKTSTRDMTKVAKRSHSSKADIILPTKVVGSGIGYSTHNNPISPIGTYGDLETYTGMELPRSYKILHPLKSLFCSIRMANKRRVAHEWEKARQYCNIYDAYVLLGAQGSSYAKNIKSIMRDI